MRMMAESSLPCILMHLPYLRSLQLDWIQLPLVLTINSIAISCPHIEIVSMYRSKNTDMSAAIVRDPI